MRLTTLPQVADALKTAAEHPVVSGNKTGNIYIAGIHGHLDASLARAGRLRALNTVLLEFPNTVDSIKENELAKTLGFQELIPVNLDDKEDIKRALLAHCGGVFHPDDIFLMDGHDRIVKTVFEIAREFELKSFAYMPESAPLNKIEQRRAIDKFNLAHPDCFVHQPMWHEVDIDLPQNLVNASRIIGFPAVLKAANGCAGLNVVKVLDEKDLLEKAIQLQPSNNYGGKPFDGYLLERYIPHNDLNKEFSAQGFVQNGVVHIESISKKMVVLNEANGTFREFGHIMRPLRPAQRENKFSEIESTVINFVAANGYKDGPFSIDLMRERTKDQSGKKDRIYVLEGTCRLPGVYEGTEKVAQRSLGDMAIAAVRHESIPENISNKSIVVGWRGLHVDEVERADLVKAAFPEANIEILKNMFIPDEIRQHNGVSARLLVSSNSRDQVEKILTSFAVAKPQD